MPVQSIAPVRRSFLDSYPGPILLIEPVGRYQPLTPDLVQQAALSRGVELSELLAHAWSRRLRTRAVREDVAALAREVSPPLEPIPDFARDAIELQRAATARYLEERKPPREENRAIFRGFPMDDWSQWWPVFFYRFVDPRERMGAEANVAGRLREASAEVLPWSWVVWHCPPRGEARAEDG